MPKLQKSALPLNLESYRVWTADTDPTSRYFRLTQLPDTLTGGKNAFLINGSPELDPDTEVLVEIKDANGNPVFSQPIRNYVEGAARVVSIEVYTDTAPGLGTITLLGVLRRDTNGTVPPAEFQNKYNVRWTRKVAIAPYKVNSTPIRLYNRPTITVSELLAPFRDSVAGVSASVAGTDATFVGRTSTISVSDVPLTRHMIGGEFSALVDGSPFTASIAKVLSDGTARLSKSPTGSDGKAVVNYSTADYNIRYQTPTTFVSTSLSRSFAEVTISKLATFSGDIARAKLYARSIDQPGAYQLITDVPLEAFDLTVTSSLYTGDQTIQTGYIHSQSIIDQFWEVGHMNGVSSYGTASGITASYDSSELLDSLYVSTPSFGALASTVPLYFIGLRTPLACYAGLEYTFSGNLTCVKSDPNIAARLDVYLYGESFPSGASDNLGVRLASYTVPAGQERQVITDISQNILAERDGVSKLRFVAYGGQWHVSDVRFRSARETGYNPDEIRLVTPLLGRRFERMQFKAEMFDANSNVLPITIESTPVYFDGGNFVVRGDDNRVDGSLTLAPSGSGLVLTSRGWAQGGAIYAGAGIPGNNDTPIFIGMSQLHGGVITFGDKFSGRQDGGAFNVNMSGTIAVQDRTTAEWLDVRDVINGATGNSEYAIETATAALVSASFNLNYSASVLLALDASNSASLAQQAADYSASIAFELVDLESQIVAGSQTILDQYNQIVRPDVSVTSKLETGLYLESSSMGFFNKPNNDFPVLINSLGQFRFADLGSYVGGADPYTRMVGMANGAFVVRTGALYMSSSGFMLVATSSGANNAMVLGLASTFASGSGLYVDGAGNFRVGAGTGSVTDYLRYSPSVGLDIQTQRANIQSIGLKLSSDPASAAGNVIKLGPNVTSITLNNSQGFYADGAGNVRFGTDVTGSDYFQFVPGAALQIRSRDFYLSSSFVDGAGVPNSLAVNTSFISLGAPAPLQFNPSASAIGFYVNRAGQFFIGSSSYVNPTEPENQKGNFLSFGNEILNVRSSMFRLSGGNITLDSANNGLLALGSATTLALGEGFYADGLGNFRIGTATGGGAATFIQFSAGFLLVQGRLLVQDPHTSTYVDVRGLISGSVTSSFDYGRAYSIETATAAQVSASAALAIENAARIAADTSNSSSLAQQASLYSGSLAASIASNSGSAAQAITTATIIDQYNQITKPVVPAGTKLNDGLYIESASLGFFHKTQGEFVTLINSLGQFRFADPASYVGGADPYTRMVGFANGAFVVRTGALYISASGLVMAATSSGVNNVIRLGLATSFASGSGLYVDGAGNFRVGAQTGSQSDYLRYGPTSGLAVQTSRLNVIAGGMQLIADPSTGTGNAIKLGHNIANLTLNNNQGFYADGGGNVRFGTDITGSDYFQFVPGAALQIRSRDFYLSSSVMVGSIANSLTLNTSVISLGAPAPTAFNPSTAAQGFFVNRAGQIFIGSGSNVDPTTPQNQKGNFISFGNEILNIRADVYRLSGGGITLDSANGGLLGLGSATTVDLGAGFYADGTGNFRVGSATAGAAATFLKYASGVLTVQGRVQVIDPISTLYVDVRGLISGSVTSSLNVAKAYSIETATAAALSASNADNALSASISTARTSVSASLAQQSAVYSASLAASIVSNSGSAAQAIATATILDQYNQITKPVVPAGTKLNDGLYIESASLGFFNKTHGEFATLINSLGQFRFADPTSYIGGADPYQRMVGFANGAFVVRTGALYISASGLVMAATSSGANNVIRLGLVTSFQSGSGFYADGAGSFRVGAETGSQSDYLRYSSAAGLQVQTSRVNVTAAGLQVISDPSTPSANVLKLGAGVTGITLANRAGFYADGDGNVRFGTDITGSEYFKFVPGSSMEVKSSNFALLSSGSGNLAVNTSYIAIGSPAPVVFNPTTAVKGFFASKDGQVFIGSGSDVNPLAPQNQKGNFISFGNEILNIRSTVFRFTGGNITLDSANNGTLALGSATDIDTGAGLWADGLGTLRLGSATGTSGTFLKYASGVLTVQGTVRVIDPISANFVDVRGLISGSVTSSLNVGKAYAIETATAAALSASNALSTETTNRANADTANSASLAQQSSLYSASLAAKIVSNSGSAAQAITTATIIDQYNQITKPVVPAGSKLNDGLYIESASLGFFKQSQGEFATLINSLGQFRFADPASYIGGADPYQRMVGFANGAFVVRTGALYISASGLVMAATSSGVNNVIRLGLATSFEGGTGIYADGAGNFRAGTTSDYVRFSPAVGLEMASSRVNITAAGLQVLSDPSTAAANVIRLGASPGSITFTDGQGSYIDGAGNVRFGASTSTGNNYFQYSAGGSLTIRTSVFNLAVATTSGSTNNSLNVNSDLISLGSPAPAAFNPSAEARGFYVNRFGQFFIGVGSNVNPAAPQSQTGNFLSFGNEILNIRSQVFRFTATGISLDSANNGTLALGSATDINNGAGFWADGLGTMRVGSTTGDSGTFLKYSSGVLTVQGTIRVIDPINGTFVDVRGLISGSVTSSVNINKAYAIETATAAELSASYAMSTEQTTRYNADLAYSASAAQQSTAYSASLASVIVSNSGSAAQAIAATSIIDQYNQITKPVVAAGTKLNDGLYIESASLGFFKKDHGEFATLINSLGQFRFADPASYVGGGDPYSRMVGFANGAFVVRTGALYISASGLILAATGSGVGNVMRLGTIADYSTGTGVYADGAGNFRAGTTSDYIRFSPSIGVGIASSRVNITAAGMQIYSDPATAAASVIRLGNDPTGMTFNDGNGVYFDGAGNVRFGASAWEGNNYFQYSAGGSLTIKTSTFDLAVSTTSGSVNNSLNVNGHYISLGSPSPTAFNPSAEARGFYVNRFGQFFIGVGSNVNPAAPESQTGNFLSFGNEILNIRSQVFRFTATGISLDSANNGTLALGSATSLSSGNGFWADGGGNFRVGTSTGGSNPSYIQFTGSTLTVRGQVSVTDNTAADTSEFKDIKDVIANYIAFGPFGFYVSNL